MRRWRTFWQLSAAIVLSLIIHFSVVALNSQRPVVIQATGDADFQVEALGNSFANLAAGIETPEPVTEAPIEPTMPVESRADPIDPTALQPTDPPPSNDHDEADITRPSGPTPTEAPEPEVSNDVQPTEPAALRANEVQATEQTPSEAPDLEPVETVIADALAPAEINPLAVLAPVETTDVVASEDVPLAPPPVAVEALRAEAQAARVERERARQQERERAEEAARQAPASRPPPGNADTNAQRGEPEQASRPQPAQTTRTAPTQEAANPSNATAVSNYPGQVFRRIQRIRQRQVDGAGTVRLQFTIGPNGGLSSIRVFASSGSPSIDEAALNHVRRAAPFAQPPLGAQTTFMFNIDYR